MHRAAQTLYLFRCHADGYNEREDNRQRPRFAALVFQLEKSERLLNAVLEELEIFLLQTAHRSSLQIGNGGVHRNEISIDAQDIVRFFLFFSRVDLPWSLLRCWRRILRLARKRSHESEKHGQPGRFSKATWESLRQMPWAVSLCVLSVLCVSVVTGFRRKITTET